MVLNELCGAVQFSFAAMSSCLAASASASPDVATYGRTSKGRSTTGSVVWVERGPSDPLRSAWASVFTPSSDAPPPHSCFLLRGYSTPLPRKDVRLSYRVVPRPPSALLTTAYGIPSGTLSSRSHRGGFICIIHEPEMVCCCDQQPKALASENSSAQLTGWLRVRP